MPQRSNRRRRRRRGGLGPVLRLMSLLLMAVAVVAALTLFFKVQEIEVTGNVRYTREEILEVAQIEPGDNLVLLDKYGMSRRIYTKLPYITNVSPRRKLPDKLIVEVTETRAVAAVEGDGAWWLLSSNGKILESIERADADGYMILAGVSAVEPEAAGWLQLEEEANITTPRLVELLTAMESRDMLGKAGRLDTRDAEKLILEYDGRFRVEMFYDADFAFKLNCLDSAVAQLEPNEKGILRMTMDDDNEVRFIPDM